MRTLLLLFLNTGLILASCSTTTLTVQPPTATPSPDLFDTPWEDRSLFRDGLVSSQHSVLDQLAGASVYHLEFHIAEDLYHISGTEKVHYTNTEDVELSEIHFRLFPNILGGEMTVTNLTVDEEEVRPHLALDDSLMIVPLASPLAPGQSVVLQMGFAVTVPQVVHLNFGALAYFDNVLSLAHAYPMVAVYDDEEWNAEIPPQSGDVTYADAAFYLAKITAPKNVVLVTSGHLIDRTEAGELQTISVASGPARDFFLAASPDYQKVSQTVGEVTIHSYAPEGAGEGAQMAAEVAARAIEIFSQRYAPYPYTEFDIVATSTLALGIEYPGIVVITSRVYDVNGFYRGSPSSTYLESTVAHEVGHQWFYNLVGNDQLDDPWLDEALTQFITLQYYADEYGPDGEEGYRDSLEARWSRVGWAEIPVGLPVESYSAQEYGAIVYGRGPLFFVALREEMGAETFDTFLRVYTEELSWEVATPEALHSMAEQHCACDLDRLFAEWVYP
jgi:hypothetical protein